MVGVICHFSSSSLHEYRLLMLMLLLMFNIVFLIEKEFDSKRTFHFRTITNQNRATVIDFNIVSFRPTCLVAEFVTLFAF